MSTCQDVFLPSLRGSTRVDICLHDSGYRGLRSKATQVEFHEICGFSKLLKLGDLPKKNHPFQPFLIGDTRI